jgi:hypothetical protein
MKVWNLMIKNTNSIKGKKVKSKKFSFESSHFTCIFLCHVTLFYMLSTQKAYVHIIFKKLNQLYMYLFCNLLFLIFSISLHKYTQNALHANSMLLYWLINLNMTCHSVLHLLLPIPYNPSMRCEDTQHRVGYLKSVPLRNSRALNQSMKSFFLYEG